MKTTRFVIALFTTLASFLFQLTTTTAIAQQRNAGQMVVPIGHENEDSVRFQLFNMSSVRSQPYNPAPGSDYIDSVADEFQVNFEGAWGGLEPSAIGGNRLGSMARGAGEAPDNPVFNHATDLGFLSRRVKQRLYHALPDVLPYRFSSGFFWRYNDANIAGSGATVHNETCDRNDINPYVQYPQNSTFANQTFLTRRYNIGNDTVSQSKFYGDEGRVILGWSEERNPHSMMMVIRNLFSQAGEAPKLFSTHLDFNIETHPDSIDQSNKGTRATEDLPLMRVQVLFKRGEDNNGPGWPARPMVPFRTTANPNNPGWWLVADQIVTKRMYDTLPNSWRKRDRLENGSNAQPWEFKQLYLRLADMPQVMKELMRSDTTEYAASKWGSGAANQSKLTSYLHPDLLSEEVSPASEEKWILEIRVLSTYRSTVRVRSLAFQDTMVDKFMYRQKFGTGDSTHSCDPLPAGRFKAQQAGGWDDSLAVRVANLASETGGKPREVLVNDTDPWEAGAHDGLLTTFLGVLDQIGAKRNIHVHYREQDNSGGITLHYRRARMSLDGVVPSMYETQYSFYYGGKQWYSYVRDGALINVNCGGCSEHDAFSNVIPHDYIYNILRPSGNVAWPSSEDYMFNTVFARSNVGGDSLRAYKVYTDQRAGMDFQTGAFRNAARHALQHPKDRRLALETAVQGWWEWKSHTWYDTVQNTWVFSPWRPKFKFRPTTPEETTSHIWVALANGFSSFNIAEPFSLAGVGGTTGGPWGMTPRTHSLQMWKLDHSRNWGHIYGLYDIVPLVDSLGYGIVDIEAGDTIFNKSSWVMHGDTSIVTGNLPEWYQGYSNTYRAYKKVVGRINSSYGPNAQFPISRFEWLDAYSAQKALSPVWRNLGRKQDSVTHAKSFLKVTATSPVDPWLRGPRGEYIDKSDIDSAHRTYLEVGIFRDRLNGTLVPRGMAALIVSTRLWPTLNDSSDHAYYNQGLTRKADSSHSTLGDIDVRKVYMKLDPTKMHDSMKSTYYVVRDIWHPDTTWLVHKDSSFAVYIKPGDAKFLYIEKAIAIHVSPTAMTEVHEQTAFGFNNGRRVAEREGGTRSVVAYTRGGKLYVSYPGEGQTFEGYHERSAGDAVASGFESLIDTNVNAHPSVCVARNDTAVAMVWWTALANGDQPRIRVGYQKKPYEQWKFATYELPFEDHTLDGRGATPVLTPLTDTSWFVASRNNGNPNGTVGILGFRFLVDPTGQPMFVQEAPLHIDDDTTALLPTVASRPLPDSMYPVRIAWEKEGSILRRAIAWSDAPVMTGQFVVSAHLPSNCDNHNPSIAMAGHLQTHADSPKVVTEDIVWESVLMGKQINSDSNYWPVNRAYVQRWNQPGGLWNIYTVFRPDSHSTQFHYPNVASSPKIEGVQPSVFKDRLRIMWQNLPIYGLEGRHWIRGYFNGGWSKSIPGERGFLISQSQTTDSIEHWTTDGRVNHSMVWTAQDTDVDTLERVRITRGWINKISTAKGLKAWQMYQVYLKPVGEASCTMKPFEDIRHEKLGIRRRNETDSSFVWDHVEPDNITMLNDVWSADGIAANRSHEFSIKGDDSLWIARHMDTLDLPSLQAELLIGDHVTWKLMLLRASDSSWVATIDSINVTRTTARYPGSGLDPDYASIKMPANTPEIKVFVAVTLERGFENNNLERSYAEILLKEEDAVFAAKRAVETKEQFLTKLNVTVHPNPFNPVTRISISELHGLRTTVELYDQLGKKLQTLFDDTPPNSVLHIALDATELSSGTYMVRVVSGSEIVTRKIQLVK